MQKEAVGAEYVASHRPDCVLKTTWYFTLPVKKDVQTAGEEAIPLSGLRAGTKGTIVHIGLKPAECQRIMELGLIRNTEVKLLKIAPLGDPMEILVRGSRLSIRKSQARHILVRPAD